MKVATCFIKNEKVFALPLVSYMPKYSILASAIVKKVHIQTAVVPGKNERDKKSRQMSHFK